MKRAMYVIALMAMMMLLTSCKVTKEYARHQETERVVTEADSMSRQQWLQVVVSAGTVESGGRQVEVLEMSKIDETEHSATETKNLLPWWVPWVISIVAAVVLAYCFKKRL